MRARISIFAGCSVCLALSATPLAAQEPGTDPFDETITVKLKPAFETSDVLDTQEEFVNKSEFSLAYNVKAQVPFLEQKFSLTAGLTASPTRFSSGPDKSSIYGEILLGKSAIRTRELLGFTALAYDSDRPQDAGPEITPFVNLRHTETFANFLGADTGDNQVLSGGFELRDLYSLYCVGDPGPEGQPWCDKGEKVDGISYAASFDASRTWSADPADENATYQLKGILDWVPKANTFRPSGNIYVKRVLYTNALTPTGDERKDWKYGIEGSIDFAPLIDRKAAKNLSVQIGVSQSWLESNDPAEDASDFRVFASLGYTFGL